MSRVFPADGPYLESLSIYDYDLDRRILTLDDYDLILPAREVLLPPGAYRVKLIHADIFPNARLEVRYVADRVRNMDEAYAHGRIEPAARLTVNNGQVELVVTGDGLLFSPERSVLLSLRYSRQLSGIGPHLLSGGAIQPSDYKEFNKQFSTQAIPSDRIMKEVIVNSRSQSVHIIHYRNASEPNDFPPGYLATHHEAIFQYEHRWGFTIPVHRITRAAYFDVFAMRL